MTEIYFDDYHLHSLTTAGLPTGVKRGLEGLEAPSQRLDAYDNPGGDGQTIANALHGGRLIVLEGWIKGDTAAEYRTNRSTFHQLAGIARDASGRITPKVLKLTDAAGNAYRLNCMVRSLKNPDIYPTRSEWQLQLVATDFRLYSESEKSSTITLPVSGGITFPFDFPESFGASSGGSATLTNAGTLATPPTIVFHGPMQNPRLSNDTTGQTMELTYTLNEGDQITVNMQARTMIQGTNTNRMSTKTTTSRFWELAPGANVLSFAATSFDAGYVVITFRDAYIGL